MQLILQSDIWRFWDLSTLIFCRYSNAGLIIGYIWQIYSFVIVKSIFKLLKLTFLQGKILTLRKYTTLLIKNKHYTLMLWQNNTDPYKLIQTRTRNMFVSWLPSFHFGTTLPLHKICYFLVLYTLLINNMQSTSFVTCSGGERTVGNIKCHLMQKTFSDTHTNTWIILCFLITLSFIFIHILDSKIEEYFLLGCNAM